MGLFREGFSAGIYDLEVRPPCLVCWAASCFRGRRKKVRDPETETRAIGGKVEEKVAKEQKTKILWAGRLRTESSHLRSLEVLRFRGA